MIGAGAKPGSCKIYWTAIRHQTTAAGNGRLAQAPTPRHIFEIFNPILQARKFDPDGDYIRMWIPELRNLDSKAIHAPWEKGIQMKGYPAKPIIERDLKRTLQAYQVSKNIFNDSEKK